MIIEFNHPEDHDHMNGEMDARGKSESDEKPGKDTECENNGSLISGDM